MRRRCSEARPEGPRDPAGTDNKRFMRSGMTDGSHIPPIHRGNGGRDGRRSRRPSRRLRARRPALSGAPSSTIGRAPNGPKDQARSPTAPSTKHARSTAAPSTHAQRPPAPSTRSTAAPSTLSTVPPQNFGPSTGGRQATPSGTPQGFHSQKPNPTARRAPILLFDLLRDVNIIRDAIHHCRCLRLRLRS